MRGPRSQMFIGGAMTLGSNYSNQKDPQKFAEDLGISSRFIGRDSGIPGPGETLRIVAINRTTGYTGSATFTLGSPSSGDNVLYSGSINQRVPELTLTPPNLKVWARRIYDIEHGLTKGEKAQYLIGHEGAATRNDTLVAIFTEWLDEYGKPLPEGLGENSGKDFGLSGRLAKLTGNELTPISAGTAVDPDNFDLESIAQGSAVVEFGIKPGRQAQLIRLKSDHVSNEHYYVNVFGRAINKEACPHCEYDQTGKNEGILETRPNHYTPFYVPRYDEEATLALKLERNRLRVEEAAAQAEGGTPPDEEDKLGKLDAQYAWVLRPEYQFTLLDIQINEINAIREITNSDGSETETIRNLLDDNNQPVITSSEDLVRVLYSLILPEGDMLQGFDGERQYVLSLAGDEVLITASENGQLEFEDTRFLDYLDVEDFLLLSLYVANDEANLLWQWAFSTIEMVNDADQPVGISESVSHPRPMVSLGRNASLDAYQVSDFSVQAGTPATVTFSLRGRVLCDVADVVADGAADIGSVDVVIRDPSEESGFRVQTIQVTNVSENTVEQNEYLPDLNAPPVDRKHTFWGEFSETITMPVYGQSESIVVEAENAVYNMGYASLMLNFNLVLDEQENIISIDLVSVDQPEPTDRGLFLPVWAKVTDGTIRTDGDRAKTRVDVRKKGSAAYSMGVVKNEDTQLAYGGEPLLVVTKPLKDGINAGNILYLFDLGSETPVAYYNVEDNASAPVDIHDASQASVKTKMAWGHVSDDSPPNYYKYAENTAITIDWYSEIFSRPGFIIKEVKVFEKVRNQPAPRFVGVPTIWEPDDDVLVFKDVQDSSGLVKTIDGTAMLGHRFAVQLNGGAKAFPEKRLGVLFEYRDENGQVVTESAYAAYFRATTLKTIILAVDGFAYDATRQVIDSTNVYGQPGLEELNAFAQIFKEGHTINRDTPALSALPTITWANWPGVFGGGAPRDHGVLGNSFFRRDVYPYGDGPIFSGGKSAYEKLFQQGAVALLGRMNSLAKDSAESIYDKLAVAMGKSGDELLYVYSVRPFYTKHDSALVSMSKTHFPVDPFSQGHSWEAAQLLDDRSDNPWSYYPKQFLEYVGEFVSFHPYLWDGRANVTNLSVGAGPEAERTWNTVNKDKLDVMSIYFPGPDNVGHSYGTLEGESVGSGSLWTDPSPAQSFDVTNSVNGLAVQAEHVTARGLSKLWARIRDDGYANAVMFALVADHGQHAFFGVDHSSSEDSGLVQDELDRRNNLAKAHNLYVEDVKALFERRKEDGGLDLKVWERPLFDSILYGESRQVIFSGNGGLGQFYLRSDGRGWKNLPTEENVFEVATYLAQVNAIRSGQLEREVQSGPVKVKLKNEYIAFDYLGMESPKISKKYLEADQVTQGAFGSPAAIFVRSSAHGGAYRWFKVQFELDDQGEVRLEERADSSGVVYYVPKVIDSTLEPISAFLQARGNPAWPDFEQRLAEMNDPDRSGDVIVIMDGEKGYLALDNEGDSYPGWHGGPTVSESYVPLMVAMPGERFATINGSTASPVQMPAAMQRGGGRCCPPERRVLAELGFKSAAGRYS